ncbi:MAG: hypothetical protein AABY44_03610 [Nitrospirota bacterium]
MYQTIRGLSEIINQIVTIAYQLPQLPSVKPLQLKKLPPLLNPLGYEGAFFSEPLMIYK